MDEMKYCVCVGDQSIVVLLLVETNIQRPQFGDKSTVTVTVVLSDVDSVTTK
jgi:hypothetical protein